MMRMLDVCYRFNIMLLRVGSVQRLFRPFAPFSTKKIEVFINNKPYQVDNNLSIFQAAKENGIEIPRFCYHERLKVAGNCRMCLVEVQKSPKPVASCCSQVAPAMKIHTNSQPARLARGGVMEFLLANHPLDCPICDQGGECDLQNNSHYYGYAAGRYQEYKRAVQDKNVGPLVVTHMNRCIHCTRCIRFSEQVAGFHDLGTSGRGRGTEINTYVQKMLFSELSGNLADVCPVGALNNGPFAYTSRPYELLTKNSIDLMDSLGSNVSIDYKENTIMRVNPRVHEAINEEWLSDKSRQAYDGLKRQRLRVPLLRKGADFAEQDWEDALAMIASRIDKVDGKDIACGIGQFESVENIQALKDFLNALNSFNYEFRKTNSLALPNHFRADYLFNSQIEMIEDADVILLVGVNPRTEAPVLNSRILKAINKKKAKILSVGTPADLTYGYTHLGNSASTLSQIASGKHPVSEELKAAKLPLLIIGRDALTRSDSQAVLTTARNIASTYKFVNAENGWNGFNVLHRSQGQINALELGIDFKPTTTAPKVIFLLGCDNNILPSDIPKDSFVVYIGSHGDQGAQYADVILPAAAYTQRSGTYVNTEGRVQMGLKVVEPPGHSREQWEIIRALSEECGVSLPYNSVEQLRSRIYSIAPHLLKYDYIQPTVYGKIVNKTWGSAGSIEETPLVDLIDNYYMTDSISRNSVTMAKCSTAFNPVKLSNFQKIRQQF